MIGFILKVFLASTFLSFAIKYGGIYLPVQGNTPTALIAVLTPSILMAVLFVMRGRRQETGFDVSAQPNVVRRQEE